jgi:hypothetical protein
MDEGKSGQNGGRFTETQVGTGPSSAFVCIIHRRKIVKDQGGSVKVLDPNGELNGRPFGKTVALSQSERQLSPRQATGMAKNVRGGPGEMALEVGTQRQELLKAAPNLRQLCRFQ